MCAGENSMRVRNLKTFLDHKNQRIRFLLVRVDFHCRVIFTWLRACVKFTFANKIEAMDERSHESVKVEPLSTSCLISTLYILPLFYLRG